MPGVPTLIRLILRRDRVKLPVWIGGIILSLVMTVPLLREIYAEGDSLETLYQTFGTNPAGVFLTGPMDAPTFGAFMLIETLLWWGMAIALMNTLFVVRHTRQNEEIGAQELIASGRVHRASSLVAALITALGLNTIMTIGIAIGMTVVGTDWSAEQSWLYACTFGVFGMVWASLAAIVVQLVQSARTANGLLAAMIGAGFVLRGVGDFLGSHDARGLLQPEWCSWLTPFGWMQATRSLTMPEWWPLTISAACVIIASVIGFWLLGLRDVGAGILPARRGRAHASRLLRSPLGLAWRLQRNILIGWASATLLMTMTIGALVPEMSHVYDSNANMKHMIAAMGGTGAMIPSFLSAMMSIIMLMVVAYAIHSTSRLRSEEVGGRLEPVLATPVSRSLWISSHFSIVIVASALQLALAGLIMAMFVNSSTVDYSANLWQYAAAGLSYLPVVAVFAGLYVLLSGALPRAAALVTWTYYGYVLFMTWLGPLLRLDDWIMNLSIVSHLATPPANDISITPLIVMTLSALAMSLLGYAAWRRRDITNS